jgi:alpha-L-fucosidase 2
MINTKKTFSLIALCCLCTSLFAAEPELKLWYRQPAALNKWNEALPVGNGRIGAMVFGGVYQERLALNDNTVWSCIPGDYDRKGAFENFPSIRQLLFEWKYPEAEARVTNDILGERPLGSYQPLGDLFLTFDSSGIISGNRR